jgi:hypothetical protein
VNNLQARTQGFGDSEVFGQRYVPDVNKLYKSGETQARNLEHIGEQEAADKLRQVQQYQRGDAPLSPELQAKQDAQTALQSQIGESQAARAAGQAERAQSNVADANMRQSVGDDMAGQNSAIRSQAGEVRELGRESSLLTRKNLEKAARIQDLTRQAQYLEQLAKFGKIDKAVWIKANQQVRNGELLQPEQIQALEQFGRYEDALSTAAQNKLGLTNPEKAQAMKELGITDQGGYEGLANNPEFHRQLRTLQPEKGTHAEAHNAKGFVGKFVDKITGGGLSPGAFATRQAQGEAVTPYVSEGLGRGVVAATNTQLMTEPDVYEQTKKVTGSPKLAAVLLSGKKAGKLGDPKYLQAVSSQYDIPLDTLQELVAPYK